MKVLDWLIVVALIALVGVFSLHTLASINQDIGRHLTLGKMIVETGHIPEMNLFSYTAPDFPFTNHHWLGEVLLYLASLAIGLKGLIVLKALSLMGAFGLALLAAYRRENTILAAVVGLCSIFILIERTDVRPEFLSFIFLGWYLFVLYKIQNEFSILNFKFSKYFLWSLPVIQVIWVNTHIYFFMGPVLFAAYILGEAAKSNFKFPILNFQKIGVGCAIILANFINPTGWYGAFYPLFILGNYGYTIVENQTPFFLRAYNYPSLTTYMLFAGMILVAASFVVNYKKIKENIFGLMIILVSGGLSLFMIRNYPLFALIMLPVALKNINESGLKIKSFKASLAMLIVILSLGVSVNQINTEARLRQVFGLHVPLGAQKGVDFVRASGIGGPMFNNFDIGSFLIWKLPEEKVFIDGRPEAYPADFIKNVYIKMQEDEEVWNKYSDQYNINFVFWYRYDATPWSRIFVQRILRDPKWPLVYADDSTYIFLKNTPANSVVINAFKIKN